MSKKLTAVLTTLTLSAVLGACSSGSPEGNETQQTVKVGGIFDLSGPTSDVGVPYSKGIEGFVTYWNQQGNKPKIKLVSEDARYDVPTALRVYSRLKQEGVVAIQGWGTGDTEALRGRVTADHIPFMSVSYAQTLTDPSKTPFNFVPGTTYSLQMRLALQHIARQSPGAHVASFYSDTPFGESPQQAGAQEADHLGLGFKTYAMPAGATDYEPQLNRAKAQGATYVIIQNVPTPAAQLVKNIKAQGLDMKVVCLNACAGELLTTLAGKAAEGALGIMPFAPVSAPVEGLAQPRKFLADNGGNLDKQGVNYVQAWYTMAVMAEGIKYAADHGKVTGNSVKQALQSIGAFNTGDVSTPIDFSDTSHAGMKSAATYQVKNGKWTILTPSAPR
ncbi:ABC transporter substrate-binding protein [Streptomyces sp. NPDC005529]|uniref:ABC transporter substrate-binding protein n=1 Tax=unclassified Streptomyces TaxID=2593676 RepID=UPI0033B162CF